MGFKLQVHPSKADVSLNKTLRLKEKMINEIQEIADKNNVSFNYVVSQMLQYCLDNLENWTKGTLLKVQELEQKGVSQKFKNLDKRQ